jgi:hypothetical protein
LASISRSASVAASPAAVDHHSFRDLLDFGIGFAISENRALLRRLLKEHVADDARQQLAKRVIEQISSFPAFGSTKPSRS